MQACVLYDQCSSSVRSVRFNMHVASSLLIRLLYSKILIALALSSQESLKRTEPLTPYRPARMPSERGPSQVFSNTYQSPFVSV